MSRTAELNALARRALAHFSAGTTDQAPATMRQSIAAYTDAARYAQEVDAVFRRRPLALAMSLELPGPGTYLAYTPMGVPVVLTRDTDGRARVFLNACRHRGAPVCEAGRGKASRFVCPYHAWSYDRQGRLVGMYGKDTFGEIDAAEHGLTELHSAERAGFVWACLTPGLAFDIDAWLGDMGPELETLDLAHWHLYTQRDLPGPGWKVTLDGYLEVYHHDSVHGRTVGQYTIGNLLVHDTYGPHQRMVFGRKNLPELATQAEVDWNAANHIRLIHSVFPNLSVSGVVGGQCLVSQIFPGPTPDTTLTRQSVLCATAPEDEASRAAAELFSAMTLQAVRDEDYAIGARIQAGIHSGANREFIYGRNEPAVQHYHRSVERCARGEMP